ncbi:dehydrogenase [Legionella beliardensis]|uniref:Dehydrogenase n=1 Tax=Legionella beliardensis TaxID=91822 RepID=A0A378I051_9GAMM|nr:short chain dehydrogenase [Legionella beliardensis]STX28567.1 dehydrogenase [Legionella beliardensis]
MRILIVGATGTLGQAVVNELYEYHELITAARSNSDIRVDITNFESINEMYQQVGKIDAVVSTIGSVHFAPLEDFTPEKWALGLTNKLMGQINLVTSGIKYLTDGGSFTLTSGILNRDPIRCGVSASLVNGAVDSFVKAAAIELPRGLRINAVSPTVLEESGDSYGEFFRGFIPVPAAKVAKAFAKSIEGAQTGQVYCVDC